MCAMSDMMKRSSPKKQRLSMQLSQMPLGARGALDRWKSAVNLVENKYVKILHLVPTSFPVGIFW